MSIEYINRKAQKYYLHVGKTKTGKAKYYFATKSHGLLAETIPDGFEIFENPSGQVFLRKILRKLISDEELAVVERELGRIPCLRGSRVERKLRVLTVSVADRKEDLLHEFRSLAQWRGLNELPDRFWNYEPQLQFVLVDAKQRLFQARRYCYLGSIEDWIDIGERGAVTSLAKRYIKHLGRKSNFELF